MSYRKKIQLKNNENIETRFSNWFAQLAALVKTKVFVSVVGRGGGKTTDIDVERLIDMVYEMPGAPAAWVSDTYINLQKMILPVLCTGLKKKGFVEGVHYVIEKKPPEFSKEYLDKLPAWLKDNFWKPYNILNQYKHTMVFFTGFNLTFGSLDRPSSLAGGSFVHIFGDEAKYFPESKFGQLTKAVRGYREKYGHSPYYMGYTITSDMPDINNIGEHDWILNFCDGMNPAGIIKLLKTSFIYNETMQELIRAKETGNKKLIKNKLNTAKRWSERYYIARMSPKAKIFFFIATSYINADILDVEYFIREFSAEIGSAKTSILSMKSELEAGNRFYANMGSRHFYKDGNDPYWSNEMGLKDETDCRILKYLKKDKLLEAGVDFGNMMSMVIAQPGANNTYRILKNLYTLSPEWIPELAKLFIDFFKQHEQKVLRLYYDRAGNNYKGANQDVAGKLKTAIEKQNNKPTGWKVILMSLGQGNIPQDEEYIFQQELMSGHNNKLPTLLIDFYNCKELRSSLEITPTKVTHDRGGKKIVIKEKKSERLPIHRLPVESTNFSDAFKYLMMRKAWRDMARGKYAQVISEPSVRK